MEEAVILLMKFDLTRIEAIIYYHLLLREYMTGYEISKDTQISRSNVYSSLASLEKKGAVYLAAEEKSKYIAVALEDFCDNYVFSLKNAKETLTGIIPKAEKKIDNYITILGKQNILNKARNMLLHAEQRVYFSADSRIMMVFCEELNYLSEKGLRIVILSDIKTKFPASEIYHKNSEENQIDLIIDSKEVMSGNLNENCLYSMNNNLITIFKKMLKNEIELIKFGAAENKIM